MRALLSLLLCKVCENYLSVLQILVNITDDGNPPKQQIATITVIVPRDQFKPTFSNLPNTVNISETSTPGIIVWPTTLQDNDKQVCSIGK